MIKIISFQKLNTIFFYLGTCITHFINNSGTNFFDDETH